MIGRMSGLRRAVEGESPRCQSHNGMPITGRGHADDPSNHSNPSAAAVQCSGGLCPLAFAAFKERKVLRVLLRLAELSVQFRELFVNEVRRNFLVSGELKHLRRLALAALIAKDVAEIFRDDML